MIDILIAVGAAAIVVAVIVTSIINKKKGKSSCGCDCSSCLKNCSCKKEEIENEEK